MPSKTDIEWREKMAMDRQEFNSRMRSTTEQWMNQVQTRTFAQGSHSMTMAERAQRMHIERINLSLQVAERKAGIAEKWINVGIRGEQLIHMRRARKEWSRHVKSIKRELRIARNHGEKIKRWSEAMEELIWGEITNPTLIGRAWAGMFSICQQLPKSLQRKLVRIPVTPKHTELSHVLTRVKGIKRYRGKSAMKFFKWCKDNRCIPIEMTPAQDILFEVMEKIDEGYAILGAEHQAYVAKRREDLKLMRSEHWKKHSVT